MLAQPLARRLLVTTHTRPHVTSWQSAGLVSHHSSLPQMRRCFNPPIHPYHTGASSSLAECQQLLSQYQGGRVELTMLESGLAHLVLDHPERRNAMSGSMMVELLEAVKVCRRYRRCGWGAGVEIV